MCSFCIFKVSFNLNQLFNKATIWAMEELVDLPTPKQTCMMWVLFSHLFDFIIQFDNNVFKIVL